MSVAEFFRKFSFLRKDDVMQNESWDVRMDGDMVIAGLSERTREAYLRTEKRAAPGTLRIAFNGIRFFYRHSCPRDWITLLKFRIPKETKLPTVLTVDEVQRIMNAIQRPRFRAYFWTVYSCGLRLNEALALQVGDIDSERMRIHIHRGKGAKDRLVPLPASTLDVLREYWKTHRHEQLLFPKTTQQGGVVNGTRQTMSESTVQGALRRTVIELQFTRNISIHCLRHSYATHLLEAGRRGRFVRATARNPCRER
ncbi:MAG: integrase/recombinase XerD [Planctomycetaceae bacterium]|jgi:integrase/recombinase XerD